VILWSFVGFILILWLAKLQRDHAREQEARRERQRRQRVGAAPIPGASGNPGEGPDAEEQRLLAILKERQARQEGES
jgi:hypothetical protein